MAKYTCSCGARYKFPDSALGKRAKCKKCGAVFTLEVEDEGIFALADEPDFSQPSHLENPVDPEAAVNQPQQGEVFTSSGHPVSRGLSDSEPEATKTSNKSFASNVLQTFLFPTTMNNFISFVIVCVAMVMGVFATYMPFFGYFLSIIVIGWFSAYRFMVVLSAAAGEDKIPEVGSSVGSWPEYIGYFLKWTGSWLIVMAPVLAYIVYLLVQTGMSPVTVVFEVIDVLIMMASSTGGMVDVPGSDFGIYDILVFAGMFCWPITILCIALGGFSVFNRPDLIIVTVVKTLPVYVITVIIILGVVLGQAVMYEIAVGNVISKIQISVRDVINSYFSLGILFTCISVYFEIVLMRLIGLYYFHFKHKFAWSWE